MSIQEEKKHTDENYRKLAQLSCINYTHEKKKKEIIESIFSSHDSINYQIPANNFFKFNKPDWIGNTALHIALIEKDIEVFDILLKQGADFTLKNNSGNSALHQAVEQIFKSQKSCWEVRQLQKSNFSFVKSVLGAHVDFEIPTNPTNKHGLSHFHAACMMNDVSAVEFFIKNGVSVSDAVSAESPFNPGYTPLHFAVTYDSVTSVLVLLENGADLDVTDANGLSPLHLLIKRRMEIIIETDSHQAELETSETLINRVLADCGPNQWNLADSIGLTRSHLAFTLQNTALARKAIDEGADLLLAINADSRCLPGFTALHFAAHSNKDTIQMLLREGGDINVKDAKGETPLDICLRRWGSYFIYDLIMSKPEWRNITFSDGTTRLSQFVEYAKNKTIETFIKDSGIDVNSFVSLDSPLWPGHTLLQLTITFTGENGHIAGIEKCLKLGADATIQNFHGSTALHLAFRTCQATALNEMLRYHDDDNIDNPVDENGLSHLHVACAAKEEAGGHHLEDEDLGMARAANLEEEDLGMAEAEHLVYKMLRNGVNPNCRVTRGVKWENQYHEDVFVNVGWTPLHVATACRNLRVVRLLVDRGADVHAKDINGLTPIHLLISLSVNYKEIGECLFSSADLKDSVADCGLSHLHVACFAKNAEAVEKLLESGANTEAVVSYDVPLDCQHEDEGEDSASSLSFNNYSYCDACIPSIEPLSFLRPYAGCTPLQIATMRFCDPEIIGLLVRHGADVHFKKSDGTFPFYRALDRDALRYKYLIVPELKSNETLQKCIEEYAGITMLHVNCAILDVDAVVELLNKGANVSAKVHANSPLWPDCTPLHLVSRGNEIIQCKKTGVYDGEASINGTFHTVASLLLEKGADVLAVNARQNTPVHEALRRFLRYSLKDVSANIPSLALLMKHQRDFSVNPTAPTGISHFHVACLCGSVPAVEEFVKRGVDVNCPIDYFIDGFLDGGLTPLHFAVIGQSKEVVDVLLRHGADPNVGTLKGATSLHVAVKCNLTNWDLFRSLVSAGADIHATDLHGNTPIDDLFKWHKDSKASEIFLRHGVRVNVFDDNTDEGRIALAIFEKSKQWGQSIFDELTFKAPILNPSVNDDDPMGRSPIHNIVSIAKVYISPDTYTKAIEMYVKAGFDVDRRDAKGRTALHLAVKFKNTGAIAALLENGADINIKDNDFNTPYACCFQFDQNDSQLEFDVFKILTLHVHKLYFFNLHVNQINRICDNTMSDQFPVVLTNFNDIEFTELSTTKIDSSYSLVLLDVLSELKAVAAYPTMPRILRDTIDTFFQTNSCYLREKFPYLASLLQLQYRKVKIRVSMIEAAKSSLDFISRVEIPDLCSDIILKLLTNEDLKNLIQSASAESQPRKRIRLE